MKISIVIPNYNGEELLKKNLQKVCEASASFDTETEIIIADDASDDSSIDVIEQFIKTQGESPSIRLLQSPINRGFSSTVNSGVNESSGEIIILLNTDVAPSKNFIAPLVEHFKDERVFAVGCMDESVEGDGVVLRGRGVGSFKRGFLVHRKGTIEKKDSLWVSGGSGAFRKSLWNKLGGMETLFNPFYWEDIDLSYRAQKAGYLILFEKESRVSHDHERGAIKRKYSAKQVKEISYGNQMCFVWLNITDTDLIFAHIFWLPYHLTKAILRRDWAFIFGLLTALSRLPQIIPIRRKRKKIRALTDAQVLSPFAKEYESR